MATISFYCSASNTNGTATATARVQVTFTYSTSNADATYSVTASQLSISSISYSGSSDITNRQNAALNLSSKVRNLTFSLSFDNKQIFSKSSCSIGGTYTVSGTQSVNKTTSTQAKTLKATGTTGGGSSTHTINVPTLTTYTISFNADGGTGAPGNQTKYYNTALTLSGTKPSKTGYTFSQWHGSNNVNYAAGGIVAAGVNQNVTLTAQWNINTYTVSYNANGGTGTLPPNQIKTYNVALSPLSDGNTLSQTHHLLDHWNTAQNNSGSSYDLGGTLSASVNQATTLYAQWLYVEPKVNIKSIDRIKGDYIHTTDGEIISGKTYYAQSTSSSHDGTLNKPHQYDSTIPNNNPRAEGLYEASSNRIDKMDEATSAIIEADFTWTNTFHNTQIRLQQPIVQVANGENSSFYPHVLWYTNPELTMAVDWSTTTSPITLYGYIDDMFETQQSYPIYITPKNELNGSLLDTGTTISYTLSSAYYTIDFLAGGEGLAFGMASTQAGFYCGMNALFRDRSGVMRALSDFFYPVGSYYETSLPPTGSTLTDHFNPNESWEGIWKLEIEGMVHVSGVGSSGTYGVSSNNTNTVDANDHVGVKQGGAATVALTPAQTATKNHSHTMGHTHTMAHTHTGPSHAHGAAAANYYFHTSSDAQGADTVGAISGSGYKIPRSAESATWNRNQLTGYAGTGNTGAASNSTTSNSSITSTGGQTEANGSAHENMMPYICVYRWHRIA